MVTFVYIYGILKVGHAETACNIVYFFKEEEKVMRKSLKKVVSAITAGAIALALGVTVVPTEVFAATNPSKEAIELGKKAFDPNGEYHAYFMFQADGCWVFRNPMYEIGTGIDTPDLFKSMLTSLDVTDPVAVDGEITDVTIKGNGTYTVGVKGLNGAVTNDSNTHIKFVGFSTDIPVNDQVKITDVKTKVDGITKLEQKDAFIDEEAAENPKTISVNTSNTYRNDKNLKTEFQIPSDSMEVTFTISGFAKDDPDAVESTPTPAPKADDSEDSEDAATVSMPAIVGIVVAAVVVIAGVVVVVTKKKKK